MDACRACRFIISWTRFKRNYPVPLTDNWPTDVSDRHGVCPYMRPIGRVGIDGIDVGVYVCRDRPRVCPIPMPMTMPIPIRSTDRITIFSRLLCGFCRTGRGQQITPRGPSLHAAYRPSGGTASHLPLIDISSGMG